MYTSKVYQVDVFTHFECSNCEAWFKLLSCFDHKAQL